MKCVKCGKQVKKNQIICTSCIDTDSANRNATFHECRSYGQQKGAANGICENVLLCEIIKKALINEPFFSNLGHEICPQAGSNIAYMTYSNFSEEQLKQLTKNYPECFK